MKPINIFNTPSDDFNSLLKIQNEVVYVNQVPTRASITTPQFSRKNEKYISTETPIHRGDLVYFNGIYWLLTSQVNKRYESYKGLMTPCSHDIIFDLSKTQNPPTKYLVKAPSYIVYTSDAKLAISANSNMQLIDGEIHIRIKDTSITRPLHQLRGSVGKVLFGFVAWDIIHVSFVEDGILDITCRVSTTGAEDVFDENGYMSIVGKEEFLDDSLYLKEDNGNEPEEPLLPPSNLNTDVTLLSYNNSNSGLGELVWDKEVATATYNTLVGYRVKVIALEGWGDEYEHINEIVNDVSDRPTFTIGKDIPSSLGEWTLYISSIFSDGTTTIELLPLSFTQTQVEAKPDEPPIW